MDARDMTLALINLTGMTVARLSRLAGVHRPNLVSWLAGKPQVMSEKNQLKVLDALGWRHGFLRRDQVHLWEVGDDFSACREMLRLYGLPNDPEKLKIVPVQDAGLDGGAIILGRDARPEPLVVLIRRPLGFRPPAVLNAAALGIGIDAADFHTVNDDERYLWWGGQEREAAKYLKDFGGDLLLANPIHQTIDEYWKSLEVEYAWLALFEAALKRGMSADEIVQIGQKALGL